MSLAAEALPAVALTIFGISGDLSKRKLLPALYHLLDYDLLPKQFHIMGVWRSEPNLDALLHAAERHLKSSGTEPKAEVLSKLRDLITPLQLDSTSAQDLKVLAAALNEAETSQPLTRLFYLAIPPTIFSDVLAALDGAGLSKTGRILVEKPFGQDLASAEALIRMMGRYFNEEQIYRIDHYLAKETAQNIQAFRFSNPLIAGVWSREFIDSIQITAAEMIGVEGRANFYEPMGALRDIVQSHLLQLLTLVTMEDPGDKSAARIHHEKAQLLTSIKPIQQRHVDEVAVRGQYKGYRREVDNPHSTTETFAALAVEINNSRWGGVPILLRTGKSLAERKTEIIIVFKDRTRRSVPANVLSILIQPNEGISLQLLAKKPGFDDALEPVTMDFCYHSSFDGHNPDAYQRVLIDAMRGDQSLFASSEEVLASWRLLQPILDAWGANSSSTTPLEPYDVGSWGPAAADTLAEHHGSEWLASAAHTCVIHTAKR